MAKVRQNQHHAPVASGQTKPDPERVAAKQVPVIGQIARLNKELAKGEHSGANICLWKI